MKQTILMVDDEEECLHTMALILTLQGYQVTKFTDAEKALRELTKFQTGTIPYDLLITDIEMPNMNGGELIDELQGIGITIPTIVMTGYGDKDMVIKFMRKGCSDYIDKPVSPDILLDRVIHNLDQSKKNKKIQDQSEKLAELGTFATELIHDINNILCTSCGYADLAISQCKSSKLLRSYLSKISKSTACASKLANQLVSISKKKRLFFRPLNLGTEVRNWLHMLKIVVGKNISIKTHIEPKTPNVIADQVSIERLLMNLIINSRDSMPQGGNVRITVTRELINTNNGNQSFLEKPGHCVCLSISDTGIGMDKKTLKHIFQPYFTTKKNSNGSGLGLFTVSKIVNEHKGWIKVTSEPENGSLFSIYFPIS